MEKNLPFFTWSSYQISKIAGCACAGNARNVFPPPRHVQWCMTGSLTVSFLWSRGKRSRHPRRMHNPQFYASGKKPIGQHRGCCWLIDVLLRGTSDENVLDSYLPLPGICSARVDQHTETRAIELKHYGSKQKIIIYVPPLYNLHPCPAVYFLIISLHFGSNNTAVCSVNSSWQWSIIGSGDGLAWKRS